MDVREPARLRTQGRWLRGGVTSLIALLLLAAAASLSAEFWAEPVGGVRLPLTDRLLSWLVFWSPAVFYGWALWAIRHALGEVGAGRHLQPALAPSLFRVGLALAAGAATSALVQPNLMRLMNEAGMGGPGRQPFASYLHFDVAYVAVGAVGLALILLSRVLRQAAEMQAELDEII